jgi:flavin-dependent dehydrogenase
MTNNNDFVLPDNARVAVIGGGPTGSFFSIFALKMARMIDKPINLTIFDPKTFRQCGPAGCNRCGGVISELLVQTLAVEGINLPDSVVRKGIHAYQLHTAEGSVSIATPSLENTIATVYRGGGPLGFADTEKESFDQFLLDQAIAEGAVHEPAMIDRVELQTGKPRLFSKGRQVMEADLVVGAFGINSPAARIMEACQFGYARPRTVTTAIAEIALDKELIAEHFGGSIQLFLLPIRNIKFAAMIPKGTYVTICILGKDLDNQTVSQFLEHPVVKNVMPERVDLKPGCRCLPKMNVSAPRVPYADRAVVCGDAGSTRLFKDGIGAAYLMGKAAATTAVFQGVSKKHFHKYYGPVYRSLVYDNWFGRYLFLVTDIYKRYRVMTAAMLAVVKAEQQRPGHTRVFSSILWNMFTGNERYKNIFLTAMSIPFHLDIWTAVGRFIAGRRS